MATSVKACTHQPWRVRLGWATSAMAYAHRPSDVVQRQATSTKACMHLTWHVRFKQATFANDMWHQPRPARISRGICASASSRQLS